VAAAAVAGYHAELVARLRARLGPELVGVYAGGSFALGDFDAARSDLDVAAVTRGFLDPEGKRAVVEALRHESLPVPARGLELVVYAERAVRVPTDEAAFELNLNTGAAMPLRVDLEPGGVERFWFPLDRAILAGHGVALHGPPAREVFAPLPRELLLPVVRESLEWHLRGGSPGGDAVLNACRALRWLVEGRWSSKGEAGGWALAHVSDGELVEAALAARRSSAPLDWERVERLLRAVLDRV
jgi:predicted nucleotidyltransferase